MYSTTTTTTNTTTTTTTGTAPTNTTQLNRAQPAPSISEHATPTRPDNSAYIKEILKDLRTDIAALPDTISPDFPTLIHLCTKFKNEEATLEQAQRQPNVGSELNLLRRQLPKLFQQIHRCLYAQIESKTRLDLKSLETLCMGLSPLAPPLTGSLLTEEQRVASQPILTAISAKLATILSGHFIHCHAETGVLLNALNWFSRALKADLIQKNQPAIQCVFDDAFHQMHAWSATSTKPTNIDSRQFSKCMVQLNTMLKERLINTDPGKTSGQANRATWSTTVQNLCRHFLSPGAWLYDCKLVELINITNTLKDGLEQGLLSSSDQSLAPVFNILAQRICAQEFDLKDPGSLTGLGNCANFLRSLSEHHLLGAPETATGQAVMHLVHTLSRKKISSGLNSHSAQALVNLASFLKSTDRWLTKQPKLARTDSHAKVAEASSTLIAALSVVAENYNPSWMRTPKTCSALLAALQHLWQRGLLQAEQHVLVAPLLMQLLQSIPNWKQAERNSRSTLQSLRAQVALATGGSPMANLQSTPVFAEALLILLVQLQQNKLTHYTDEERLASLQAIQIGVALGTIALNAYQPLLQSLLQTKDVVDLPQLDTAIADFGGLVTLIEALSAEALASIPVVSNTVSPKANPAKPRGPTYRGEVPQPLKQERVFDTRPLAGEQDWTKITKGVKADLPVADHQVPLPFTAPPSTAPRIVSRPSEPGKRIEQKEPKTDSAAVANFLHPVQTTKLQEAQARQAAQGLTLQQAQTAWFNLLKAPQGISLQRLQELALDYPQLLNLKAPGKQRQVAVFYALIQGKKDIVEWLMKHDSHTLPKKLGKFLIAVLNEIEIIEKRHVSGVRVFIELYLKKNEQQLQAQHAQEKPGGQPLSKQEILDKRTSLLSTEQKNTLKQFSALTTLFNEYKLLKELTGATGTQEKEKALIPVKNHSQVNLKRAPTDKFSFVTSGNMSSLKINLENMSKSVTVSAGESHRLAYAKNEDGWTTLMLATEVNDTASVKALLNSVNNKDALVQMQNKNGDTVLMGAADKKDNELVTILLDSVKDKDKLIMMTNKINETALFVAVHNNTIEIVNQFLREARDKDALVGIKNKDDINVLLVAAFKGYTEIVTVILDAVKDKDALVNIKNNNDSNALMLAVSSGHTKTVKAILNKVNDKNSLLQARNKKGQTALQLALSAGHIEIVEALIGSGKENDAIM